MSDRQTPEEAPLLVRSDQHEWQRFLEAVDALGWTDMTNQRDYNDAAGVLTALVLSGFLTLLHFYFGSVR